MRKLTQYELMYGRNEAPPEMRTLQAGPVELVLDSRDVRYAKLGEIELVRRIYFAVRDHNWDTIAGEITKFEVDDRGNHFEARFHVRHQRGSIDFEWEGRVRGDQDGKIVYAWEGIAHSDFQFNRIGVCIHQPPSTYSGQPYRGKTPAGLIQGTLPDAIAPQARDEHGDLHGIFPAVSQLTVDLPGDVTVRYDFEGDLWEMEDHRNWTDNSFKTYCTPLHLPLPQQARRGQKMSQTVTLSIERKPEKKATSSASDRGVQVSVGKSLGKKLPPIGLGMASHDHELTEREIELLRPLKLDHIRVDLHLRDSQSQTRLQRATKLAAALSAKLEPAIFVTNDAAGQLDQLKSQLSSRPPIARFLIFHELEECTAGRWVKLAKERLKDVAGSALFAGGSNANFTELNRRPPEVEDMDALTYPLNAQVHAFDEASVVETITAQPPTVQSARLLSNNKPVFVGPVTLKLRFNPNALGPETQASGTELPAPVDARQMSLFGAGWTLGSIKRLGEAGPDSITYFETAGWRGVMESAAGSPQPDLFLSEPGMVFPLYHVFADVADWKDGELIECQTSDLFVVEALAIRSQGQLHLLVANHTPQPQQITLTGLTGKTASMRTLNADTALTATHEPTKFRQSSSTTQVPGGELKLDLAPYAVTRLDIQ